MNSPLARVCRRSIVTRIADVEIEILSHACVTHVADRSVRIASKNAVMVDDVVPDGRKIYQTLLPQHRANVKQAQAACALLFGKSLLSHPR